MPSQPVCKQCGQRISGQYIQALGANWHPEHFLCAGCSKPLIDARFQVHEGKPYHTECYRDSLAPCCAYCGKPLMGKYVIQDGKSYHPQCYQNHVAPRCAYCKKPLTGQYTSYNGKPYHLECYQNHVALRCAYCGKPISGQYMPYEGVSYHIDCYRDHVAPHCAYCGKPLMGEYLKDYWGNLYCKEHENQYPKCSYCGRLVPPQQQESDTKHREDIRCPVCRASAVESNTQAQPIFSQLKQWMRKQGLTYNNPNIKIELCDRARLTQLMKGHGGGRTGTDTLGITLSSTLRQNGQEVRTDVTGIAVLQGLPLTLFQGVMVHELGHAWLIMQGIKGMPDWSVEGLCELLAYHFYVELNTPESRYYATNIERNPDKVYGDGFRRVRKIADTIGLPTFVELLRTTKRLPSTR